MNREGQDNPRPIPGVQEEPERYTLLGEHGRGGMGRVLLVSDTYLNRDIALKELLPEHTTVEGEAPTPVSQSIQLTARFLQEARITGQLEHPGIVPVHELGHRKDGTLYYTMKLVRGKTLASAIREADTLNKRLDLLPHVIDLCQAIAYAHSRSVIHRDIKPNNVMVGEFGETVVLDWGLAKVKDREDVHAVELAKTVHTMHTGDDAALAQTIYGEAVGTPMYMPPEQARGELERVDERSDVYSLGAVVYELLTGEPPHQGENVAQILFTIINNPLIPVSEKTPEVPPELAAVCEKALAKDPTDRYTSAKELAEDIQRFQTGAIVEAHEYRFSEHLRRFVRRHRPVLATAASALLLLVSLGAYSYLNILEARDQLTKSLYTSSIRLTQVEIERSDYYLAQQQLQELPPHLRHWEWGWLRSQVPPPIFQLSGHKDFSSLSSDACRIVTPSDNGTARILDTETGDELMVLSGQEHRIGYTLFSPDGSRIITASWDSTARVWDAETGEELTVFSGHKEQVRSASFSPDGRLIATASDDLRTARIWNADTGEELAVLSGHEILVWPASFSPDSRRIVTASGKEIALVWDVETGAELIVLTGHRGNIRSVKFSPDGSRIVTASDDSTACVWDTETGEVIAVFAGHEDSVLSASFSPDGLRIATTSVDGTAHLWDSETNEEQVVLTGHEGSVLSALFSPDGLRIVTTSDDETVRLWDLNTGMELGIFLHGRVHTTSFRPDGSRVVTASWDGTSRVWEVEVLGNPAVLAGHEAIVRSASFSPDGHQIVSASDDGTAHIWDAETGEELVVLSGHEDWIRSASFSPDSQLIVTTSDDSTARVWDAATGQALAMLSGHETLVWTASFSPDGHRIATVTNQTVRVWDTETGEELSSRATQWADLAPESYSPDGRRVVRPSRPNNAIIYDSESNEELIVLTGHEGSIRHASFSPDGRRVVTASDDGTVRVWNAETSEELVVLEGHGATVRSASFSPDGRRIVTASDDGTVRIWNSLPWYH
ncbi:protein kinase [Gemmatimonadota bacterium]